MADIDNNPNSQLPNQLPEDKAHINTPKKPNLTESLDTNAITDDLDPAEKDARWLRRWYPTGFVTKLAIIVLLLMASILAGLYIAAGTEAGTRYLINSVVQQTGISLKYGKGNLRDGVWIYDLHIPPKPPKSNIEVNVDKAFIKMGWRAILYKEVHLREATIHNLTVYNHKPSTGQPFSYDRLALPVNLRIDHATADTIRYQQAARLGKDSDGKAYTALQIDFKQDDITEFTWVGTALSVKNANLHYNDLLQINQLKGKIDLQNDYPLDATASVIINPLTKVYFDALDAHATGSLKHLVGTVKSRYNQSAIEGTLTAQPMEKNAPFNAKVTFKDVLLPYATERDIHLKNGTLTATGVTNDIDLRINTDLSAKDIPTGHYQGRATTDGKKMSIERLQIDVPQGRLITAGELDWQGRFNASLMNTGNGFKIRKLVSDDIAPYLPETLNGKVAVVYDNAVNPTNSTNSTSNNSDSNATKTVATRLPMHIKVNLRQDDGEVINADITQYRQNDSEKAKAYNPPMLIKANWQKYIRHHIPNVGEINSPSGQADVTVQKIGKEQHVSVQGRANIIELNAAPKGDYVFDIKKHARTVDINNLVYNGVLGDLTGQGKIQLAQKNDPLTWQINAKTNTLKANDFNKNIPFKNLSGTIHANGTMVKVNQRGTAPLTRHHINITDVDITGDRLAGAKTNQPLAKNSSKTLTSTVQKVALKGSGNGTIELMNNKLSHFAVQFNGALTAPKMPNGKLILDAEGTPKNITLNKFSHQGDVGGINAKGKLNLDNGVAWDINADMKDFDASYFVANVPSKITGSLMTDGYWHDGTQAVNIRQMHLTGDLKNQQLTATGDLTAVLHLPKDLAGIGNTFSQANGQQKVNQARQLIERINADNLKLQWGDNVITANGNQNQLVTSVNISTLNGLIPQAKGVVKGGIILSQVANQTFPNVYVDLMGRDIALPNIAIMDAKATGKLVNLGNSPSQLQLNATGINISNQPIRALQIDFSGTQADHRLDVKADSIKGQIQASLKGAINLNTKQWTGVLGNGQVGTKYAQLQQLQPAQMVLNWQNPRVELAAHCWQMVGQTGRLCLKENLVAAQAEGHIDASLQQIDSQIFSVFLPKDIAWKGELNGNALVHWKQGQHPNINASFYSDNGVLGLAADIPEDQPMTLTYDRASLIARSTNDGLKLRADIKTSNGTGSGYVDALIDPYGDNKPISGSVVLQDMQLGILRPFLPSFQRLAGTATIAGKLGGTLNQPKLIGDAEINDGSATIIGLPMKLSGINLLAHVEGTQATLDGTFKSAGQGAGTLTGTIDWAKELQAKLKLQGENLQISQPPLLFAEINPLLDIIVRPQQKYVNIAGVIDVPRATIRPPEATRNVVSKSSDVTVIDRRLAGQIDDVLKVVQPWSINADIAVDLGNRVFFRGFGANLPLAGALSINQQGQGTMRGEGVIQVAKRSKVEIFGQNFNINYARIRFDGILMKPMLNIEAIKELQGVTVGVRVTGAATSPAITVFNNGGLSEQQAMNALVTGSLNNNTGESTSSEEFKSRVNNTLAAAGLSFGLQGTRQFTNQIGRAFGLQSLTLDASGNGNDTEVNLTGYITPDLYIRYGVGVFNSTSALSMRYQLTRRLYIEARSAVNNSVDLLYNWKF